MSSRIDINWRLFPLLLLLFFLCFPLFLPSFNSWLQYCKIDIHANKGTVTRAKKRTTCFATLLQNELNSDAARFTTDNFFLPLLRTYKNVNQKRYFHRIIFCFREKGPLETLLWQRKSNRFNQQNNNSIIHVHDALL